MTAKLKTPLYQPPPAFDALWMPLIGRLLRWRWGRLTLQTPLLLIALLLIYDGFSGSPMASRNLATITPWVHFRGLAVLALLLVGNLFCMGCPFTIPRTLAKRLSIRGRRFPRVLRNKWIAIGTLFALFFFYEWLDMWASPALTAWVITAYFAASFVLEAAFTESAFCKYVCPLGSFNFTYSAVSPLQIQVKNSAICAACVGKECVNGSYSPQPVTLIDEIGIQGEPIKTHEHNSRGTPGCGTLLFAPQIQSNMDCTMCLDCARACPHDNIGLFGRGFGAELSRPKVWQNRYDISFLVIGLAWLGLVNAFGMVPPVYDLMQSLAAAFGLTALGLSDKLIEGVALLLIFMVGAGVIPLATTFAAAGLARMLTHTQKRDKLRVALASFAPIFVPIGLGFWIAHYGYHFLTGLWTIVPVFQEFLLNHRIGILGEPNWTLGGTPNLELIGALQAVAVVIGYAASLWLTQKIALRLYRRQMLAGFVVWALLLTVMLLAGLWLFSQPMEMRGVVIFD
ncbi:MAG: FesM [Anaerolineae bacterium]|nr:FesM [Anaerolineae bacterium]